MVAEVDTNELLLEFLPLKNQITLHIIETVGKTADLAPTLRLLMENFDNLIEGYYKYGWRLRLSWGWSGDGD